ncbi:glycosyltransferase [Candidatus Daviesbacteria bacterium]|nr:glycosyltransferase [Candidatus Daviesbacteria bacterium]
MRSPLVSVILPVYQQEKTIAYDLLKVKQVLDKLRYQTELICVVDGQVDQSYSRAQKVAKKYKNIKVVGYDTNKGKGYAVRFGIAKSKGEIIGFIDAGMDLNPNGLSMLLEHFEWYKADIIIGSKRHPVSKVKYPWQRRVLSLGYQLLTRILFGLKIRDTQVGMKFFRREVLEKILPRLLVKTYAFDIEILAVSHSLGYKRIFEAPVELNFRKATSSITTQKYLRILFHMLWDTLAVFYRLKILGYYSNKNHRRWRFDPELNFRVNTG